MKTEPICIAIVVVVAILSLATGVSLSEKMDADTARICIQSGKIWKDKDCVTRESDAE